MVSEVKTLLHALRLFFVLFGLWIALSGHYTILLIVAGVITAILCVAISIRMDLIDRLHPSISLSYRLPLFWFWLALEIFKSGIQVTLLILHPRLPIRPCIEYINAPQKTDIGIVTYANSITLTPGTLSISVEKENIEVHSLNSKLMNDLKQSKMGSSITKIEKNTAVKS